MLLLLTVSFLFNNGLPTAPPPRELSYLPPNLYLVEATTLRVWRERPSSEFENARFRVIRTIGGPDRLVGQEFECLVGKRWGYPPSGFGKYVIDGAVPYAEAGAEGLWWVCEDLNDKTLKPELRMKFVEAYHLTAFPYQKTKKINIESEEWLAPRWLDVPADKWKEVWVETCEKDAEIWKTAVMELYKAKTNDERRAILEKQAAAPNSPVSAWAVSLIAHGPRGPTVEFLNKLAGNDKIDPEARITLDRVLCEIDAANWSGSSTRILLFRRLLDVKSPGYDFTLGCRRLEKASIKGELEATEFAEAVGPAVAVSEKLTEAQSHALGPILANIRFKPKDRDKGFTFLTSVVDTAKSARIRMYAARGFIDFVPVSDRELRILGDLRGKETEASVMGYLDYAMTRKKE
jgi:hypothetical protein